MVVPNLHHALKSEGFHLPENCDVELEMPVNGVFALKYRVVLDKESFQRVVRALTKIGNADVPR